MSNTLLMDEKKLNVVKKTVFSTIRKKKCLIINPGKLADELYRDKKIYSSYTFSIYDYSEINWKERLREIGKNDIILFDPTGNNSFDKDFLEALSNLKLQNVKIFNIISFYESITGRIPLVHIKQEWIINNDLFPVAERKTFDQAKRVFEITLCLLLLPFCLPLMTFGMILIKLSSPGPVMFKQKRVGRNGYPFVIYKLRTMVYDQNGHTGHTTHNDSRIFPIGKFLRKTKIDELPQLLNVLRGDMSLVGPRPEKVDIVEKLSTENPYYPLRHLIRPGITGWAQVNQPTATPNENLEKLEFDLFYIKNPSYLREIKIYLKTLMIVLRRDSL